MAKKKNKKKSYFSEAERMQSSSKKDNRTEEEKQRDLNIATLIRWRRWTVTLIVVGLLAGLLGQVRNWELVRYSGIVFWMIAGVCHYKFNKQRNELIIERELNRKQDKEQEKVEKKAMEE